MPYRYFFLAIILSQVLFGQTSGDQISFNEAMSAPTDSAKLALMDKFIEKYPTSNLIANAYAVKFQAYSNLKNDSAAFISIRKYLSLIDRSQLVPALNAIAFEFAQRKFYIDSAAVFIDSAIALYQHEEPVLLNTKALVLFRQLRYKEAERVQQKVVSLLPENARIDGRYVSFYVQMGFIQLESEKPLVGIQKIILGNLVLSKQSLPVEKLDSLLLSKGVMPDNISVLRDSLHHNAVEEYLKYSTDSVMAKSKIAVSLSRNNVLPFLALRFASESYTAAQEKTIEERSGAAAAIGLTYFHLNRYQEAERFLMEAAQYAPPTETEVFISLGEVKEKLGKKEEAFDAYVSGAVGNRASTIYEKLLHLKNELYPTQTLDSIIVARQAAALNFTPEEYHRPEQVLEKDETERIVLAELFTGSECRPCQAADIAFDYLIERYRTSSLAILEYHLHIPLPDPLSNSGSEQRGEYYGVNSTPTAVFGGTTVITSGGSKLMAKNRFFLYSDIIERQLKSPTNVTVKLSATIKNDVVNIRINAVSTEKNNNLKLRVAVVEDEVFYKGANGIERHKFVVRKMVKPANGFSFPKNGKLSISQSVNIKSVETELATYYDQTNKLFTERGTGLKEMKNIINRDRLAIVAFVQNDVTREIMQGSTVKVIAKVNGK